jgi:hypothetical protein
LTGHPVDCRGQGCVTSVAFFDATIQTIDEFVTGRPITLKLLLSASPNAIFASVLPESKWQGQSIITGIGQGPNEGLALALGCRQVSPASLSQ